MNIWIINQYAVPPSLPGGTRHYSMARVLTDKGASVKIIAGNFNHNTMSPIPEHEANSYKLFHWLKICGYNKNSFKRIFNIIDFSRKIQLRQNLPSDLPDIIIGSSPTILSAFSSLILAKRLRIPFVFEIRDIWPHALVQLGKLNKWHPYYLVLKILENILMKYSDAYITSLPSTDEYFRKYKIPKEKVLFVPNCIDFTLTKDLSSSTDEKSFYALYAGSLNEANDLMTIVKAAELIQSDKNNPDIRIRIIGEGPERSKILQHIKNMTQGFLMIYCW